MASNGPLMCCFDGSENATEAVETCAALFPGRETAIVCFWQPFAEVAHRYARSLLEIVQDAGSVNQREQALAEQTAAAGADLASKLGLDATPHAVEASRALDEAIIKCADELDASMIALASRGRGGVRAVLLGNVAAAVLQRSSRPVLIVPANGSG